MFRADYCVHRIIGSLDYQGSTTVVLNRCSAEQVYRQLKISVPSKFQNQWKKVP